jgi:hypothetical protein
MHSVPDHTGFSGFEVHPIRHLRRRRRVDDLRGSLFHRHPSPATYPRYDPTSYAPYAVLDDGRTICISSGADGIGTHC